MGLTSESRVTPPAAEAGGSGPASVDILGPESFAGAWPIVRLIVSGDGNRLAASFYTPGLPDGDYDLWCEPPETSRDLLGLLARIHGDGDHYVDEHGLAKAIEDAHTIVAEAIAASKSPQPEAETADPCRAALVELVFLEYEFRDECRRSNDPAQYEAIARRRAAWAAARAAIAQEAK